MARLYLVAMKIAKHGSALFVALLCLGTALPAAADSKADAPPGPADPHAAPPTVKPKAPKPKAEVLPDSPAERDKLLSNLYAQLATAEDEAHSRPLIVSIERLWLYYGSDTVGVLMDRSLKAIADKNPELALKLLDEVVAIAPDYAEGWNRRAYVYYGQGDFERALGDLRRVMALEPNHFKALEGLGQIFKELGQKKAALEAYRKLLSINPNAPGAQDTVRDLTRAVDGQGI